MKILGIETSCDETAISLIEVNEKNNKVEILGNTVHSQIDVHASYGGVFPILAKREHQINLIPVLAKTLKEAGIEVDPRIREDDEQRLDPSLRWDAKKTDELLGREEELLKAFKEFIPTIKKPDIDYISVTVGPGLEPALWVGISFARALSHVWNIPLIPCNHMEGHVLVALLRQDDKELKIERLKDLRNKDKNEELKIGNLKLKNLDNKQINNFQFSIPAFPALSLLISGGHTQIVLVESLGSYKIVGETRDDAIGECFDKIARTLGLEYPGGPKISKLADEARKENISSPEPLPRPMIDSKNLDFSFSGLKTAALYLVQKLTAENKKLSDEQIKGIAREVEDAVTDVVVSKMKQAIEKYAVETLIIGGGVIANTNIREHLEKLARECSIKLMLPQFDHATDNGLMIALAGYINKTKAVDNSIVLKAQGTLPLGHRV